MSYLAGTRLGALGIPDGDPTISCNGDGCEARIVIKGLPPEWFLDGKAKRGWSIVRDGDTRRDYCLACTKARKAARP